MKKRIWHGVLALCFLSNITVFSAENYHVIDDLTPDVVVEVKARRQLIQNTASVSTVRLDKQTIQEQPQGDAIKLSKLLSNTAPGVVAGPFGQLFIRGNHANIQYQLDGVQLPESPSNMFGQSISLRNVDHLELITGGIPAEYGERLGAVVNVTTKTGGEVPGGTIELNYGSYITFSPSVVLSGSTPSGNMHYFLSGNYSQTDRGLDTPENGALSLHNVSFGNNEFGKWDWIVDNTNKLSVIAFNAQNSFQIPNYAANPNSDSQKEHNDYVQMVWKHAFSETAFLQLAPYWKYASIDYAGDPARDGDISFSENKHTHNFGLKGDCTVRVDDQNLVKMGFQGQYSRSSGHIGILTPSGNFEDSASSTGIFESVYVQDDYALSKSLILNAGLRFDATQVDFSETTASDSQLSPRIGLSYLMSDTTKWHAFYGKLFQPAPAENLRIAFSTVGGGTLSPYDIKAEKDDYFEVGLTQQLNQTQVMGVTLYYKDATHMLDDAQLLNTSIAQPFNFAKGYAYGAELSIQGQLTPEVTEYLNYSYEIAQGKGLSGGIFAFDPADIPADTYHYLDHVQVHTLNAGMTYTREAFWITVQGLWGSGLRTGPENGSSLPSHFTADATIGYTFSQAKCKVSLDILNLFDNAYPITIANGFNGSHYEAGRQLMVRLVKEF